MSFQKFVDSLGEVPDSVFWHENEKGDRVPHYNSIFTWLVRATLDVTKITAEELLRVIELEHKLPNLSTFQRSVANERKRREGGA